MMRTALAALLVSWCVSPISGCARFDFATAHGMRFTLLDEMTEETFPPEHVQQIEDWFSVAVQRVGYTDGQAHYAQSVSSVDVFAAPYACDVLEGDDVVATTCNGQAADRHIDLVASGACPFDSALAHEMGHLLQAEARIVEHDHRSADFWKVVESDPLICPGA